MQLSSFTNALRYFLKRYVDEIYDGEIEINMMIPKNRDPTTNKAHYIQIKSRNKTNSKIFYDYFKYVSQPFHTLENGVGESFNEESLKEISDLRSKGWAVCSLFVCYGDGTIWQTSPENFENYGELKQDLNDKDRYTLNWSAKNERGKGLWKVYTPQRE